MEAGYCCLSSLDHQEKAFKSDMTTLLEGFGFRVEGCASSIMLPAHALSGATCQQAGSARDFKGDPGDAETAQSVAHYIYS